MNYFAPSRFQSLGLLLGLFGLFVGAIANAERPSFKLDVMPVFMRYGCNAGDCHGAARGKDGFMLSLFGYDPEGDHYRLTEQYPGRRVNVASPKDSLLLNKAIGAVAHTGGKRFDRKAEAYTIIRDWIAAGAQPDPDSTPAVEGIRMIPAQIEFESSDKSIQTKIMATYSDGSERDVTRWCRFFSSNAGVVSIDDAGNVQASRAGGAHVFARFARFTEGSEVIVLPKSKFDWPNPPENNYIDQLVFEKLRKLQIRPSELCSDEHFLRRATIDLTGMLPTPEEYKAFLLDQGKGKRQRKIDELIAREDFAELWAAKWGEWLRIRGDTNPSRGNSMKAAWVYFYWLRDQFVEDRPLNELFADLITGTGSNLRDPPSNFYTMLPDATDPGVLGKDVAQLTLGIQTGCAECHNHPFDRWTMDDYYGWTSFFTGVQRKFGREGRETLISVNVEADLAKHLIDGRPMPHRFLGGDAPSIADNDPRRVLADWLTSKSNRLFRRNMANRVWEHFFGRGIVQPIDDVRISNPASNDPLLEELGRRFAQQHDYKLRDLVRDICNSRTYQLSAQTNDSNRSDNEFFSRAMVRRPRADVLFDCICQAMDHKPKLRRSSKSKAIDLFDGGVREDYNHYFYTTFGQAPRQSVCACETSNDANLSQTLHLMNGETIQRAIRDHSGLIPRLVKSKADEPEKLISELYVRALCRQPSEMELQAILRERPEESDYNTLRTYYSGVLWALLNSSEFLFNH